MTESIKRRRLAFKYKVKDSKGKIRVGRAIATESVAVRRLLQEKGYTIISVIEEKPFWQRFNFGRISAKDRSIMYRELSTMLKAGVGITQAIEIAAESPNARLRQILREIHKSLENGFAVSVAMSGYPKVFPEVEIGVVRSGEATGNLANVLEDLATSTHRSAEFIGKVRGAMIYPAFIVLVMIIVGAIILTRVIPPIRSIFETTGTELPTSTKILLAVTDFIANSWPLLIGILLIVLVLGRLFLLTKLGREVGSFVALNFPIFGSLAQQVYLARFNRTMALLIGAGVPILEAVEIIVSSTKNIIFARSLKELSRSLEQGAAISSSLARNRYFPRIMTQLLFVGQQSGDLGNSAATLADYFEGEVDAKLRTFSSLIEPFIIVLLGIAVAFIVVSVLQPIYNLSGEI